MDASAATVVDPVMAEVQRVALELELSIGHRASATTASELT